MSEKKRKLFLLFFKMLPQLFFLYIFCINICVTEKVIKRIISYELYRKKQSHKYCTYKFLLQPQFARGLSIKHKDEKYVWCKKVIHAFVWSSFMPSFYVCLMYPYFAYFHNKLKKCFQSCFIFSFHFLNKRWRKCRFFR